MKVVCVTIRLCFQFLFVLSCTHPKEGNHNREHTSNSNPESSLTEKKTDAPLTLEIDSMPSVSHFELCGASSSHCQGTISIKERVPDFRNSSICIHEGEIKKYKLKNGVCYKSVEYGIDRMEWIAQDSIIINGKLFWLLLLSNTIGGGSSFSVGHCKLFTKTTESTLHQVSEISFSNEVNQTLQVKKNAFTLNASIWHPGGGACCPDFIERGTFTIRNDSIVKLSSKFLKIDNSTKR